MNIVTKLGKSIALPKDVQASDLKWPSKAVIKYDDFAKLGLTYDETHIEMWYVERFGWCIPTLLICRAGRRAPAGTSDRTYAISLDGQPCRIGRGPHVQAEVTLYLSHENCKRLMPYVELRRKGAITANETRDRISTRRMNTMLRRSSSSWF